MDIDKVFILLPDGRCIFSKSYKGDKADSQLLGGLLSAFNVASRQWLKDGVKKFVSEGGQNFIIKDFVSFLLVISGMITADEEIYLDTIGLKFLSKYGNSIDQWGKGKISMFRDFEKTLDNIIGTTPDVISENQTVIKSNPEEIILDSITIIQLPNYLQKTAITVLTLKSCSVHEVANESNVSVDEALSNLNELVNKGYILRKTSQNQEKIYYIP